MKIVVFGPDRRTGALRDGNVVDLSCACAKYLRERADEPNPLQMAEALVPSELARLIEGGPRALDYLFGEAQDKYGPRGETLVYPAANVRLHAPRPNNARIACAGGNFADHAAAMAVNMRLRPYEGDAYQKSAKPGSGVFGSSPARSSAPTASSSIPSAAIAWTTRARSRSCSAGAAST
jgi:2-keto-4-pentenoate hydratase/2-oxohepta-3-ene-1,7-dioic acid hydratase in catechol pathway